jgi:hypothetical protein
MSASAFDRLPSHLVPMPRVVWVWGTAAHLVALAGYVTAVGVALFAGEAPGLGLLLPLCAVGLFVGGLTAGPTLRRARALVAYLRARPALAAAARAFDEGQAAEAEAAWEAHAAALAPLGRVHAVLVYNTACACLHRGDFAAARARLDALEGLGWAAPQWFRPLRGRIFHLRASTELLDGRPSRARPALDAALDACPPRVRARLCLAQAKLALREGDPAAALERLDTVAPSLAGHHALRVAAVLRAAALRQQGASEAVVVAALEPALSAPAGSLTYLGRRWPDLVPLLVRVEAPGVAEA